MKKLVVWVLAIVLFLAATSAMAEAPAAGSLSPRHQVVRGNDSFTPESYPQVWISPFYAEYVVAGYRLDEYPADFLTFAPPEGTAALSFSYDEAGFVDHDKLVAYGYYAYDRASFEVYLEDIAQENILKDGSDGMAIYVKPDSRRANALLSLKDQFGGTAKLEIVLYDYTRAITTEELGQMLTAEAERVKSSMQLVKLDHYWSTGVFDTVQIHDSGDGASAIVNANGLTLVTMEEDEVKFLAPDGADGANETAISIDSYSYAYGQETATDESLETGVSYKCYKTDYRSYASFLLIEKDKHDRPVYLNVEIECAPDELAALLELAYARVQVTLA